MTRVLFICGKARKRSPTAVECARNWPALTADCAGLSHDADEPLTQEQIYWADLLVVMEKRQKRRLSSRFGAPKPGQRILSFEIPDRFEFMDGELVDILISRLTHHFGPPENRPI
ncbi:phosphotyrosine protein phosphatase [Alisedimentitalea sp. MJ-SS2]|uniref:phosphotyrosine protein phosphatase n=1 Tax=Aliisedimentitalea sp. MJ-SS2 TaxID=3049795 RepID=UPI00291092B4|nr:phosphotyrosine protein phosphatase [Alisedimentitalea sp. MJ-SS2]MDU8927642.1 phosphotyrosine protein phosphatase [Alisedimentitalea sp. MJ-SS2]